MDRTTLPVEARDLSAPERDQCFQVATALYPGSSPTQQRASNCRIPVLKLDRASTR